MFDTDDLLPTETTALEQELSRLSERIPALVTEPIETIWDAWRCPASLLPWLAWAMSLDDWSDAWPDTVKRQAIADSPEFHRRKGTVQSVASAAALSGRSVEITEWFDRLPQGRCGTASIHIEAPVELAFAALKSVRALIYASKPKSRAVFIGAGERIPGVIAIVGGILDETLTIIDPYAYAGDDADGFAVIGVGILDETLTIVEPA